MSKIKCIIILFNGCDRLIHLRPTVMTSCKRCFLSVCVGGTVVEGDVEGLRGGEDV